MSTPPDQANKKPARDEPGAGTVPSSIADQAAQELRRKINLTVMGNYPGTTASDQFIDDLLALMYRETLAVINRKTGLIVTPEQMQTFDMLRAEQRQVAVQRYGQTEPEKQS